MWFDPMAENYQEQWLAMQLANQPPARTRDPEGNPVLAPEPCRRGDDLAAERRALRPVQRPPVLVHAGWRITAGWRGRRALRPGHRVTLAVLNHAKPARSTLALAPRAALRAGCVADCRCMVDDAPALSPGERGR